MGREKTVGSLYSAVENAMDKKSTNKVCVQPRPKQNQTGSIMEEQLDDTVGLSKVQIVLERRARSFANVCSVHFLEKWKSVKEDFSFYDGGDATIDTAAGHLSRFLLSKKAIRTAVRDGGANKVEQNGCLMRAAAERQDTRWPLSTLFDSISALAGIYVMGAKQVGRKQKGRAGRGDNQYAGEQNLLPTTKMIA